MLKRQLLTFEPRPKIRFWPVQKRIGSIQEPDILHFQNLFVCFLWNFRSKQLKRNNLLFISLFFYSTFFKRRPWPWKTCSYSLAFPHRSSLFVKLRNLYNDIISQARTYELQDCYRDQFDNKVTVVQVDPYVGSILIYDFWMVLRDHNF